MKKIAALFFFVLPIQLLAQDQYILADLSALRSAGIAELVADEALNLGFARASLAQRAFLSRQSHAQGKCGSFEAFPELDNPSFAVASDMDLVDRIQRGIFRPLRLQHILSTRKPPVFNIMGLEPRDFIQDAVADVNPANIEATVRFLSGFAHRRAGRNGENEAILSFKALLEKTLEGAATVEEISHKSITQKSLRVRFEGAEKPQEIVVLGGHIDSTSYGAAPGADDNASGSSSLFEAIRILKALNLKHPRTIEVFFYGGEELGLLGSREIAAQYKKEKKDVVAALQLDMTLHPGSGKLKIATITDYTNASARQLLAELNTTYVGAGMMESKCGYGCSDHASWHRNGYAAAFPFEAKFSDSNDHIHTPNDVINEQSSFEHAAVFSKLALAFALEVANSEWRPATLAQLF